MARDYVLQPFQRSTPLQVDYARELNEQQYAAVTASPGPALVIAGAGAGKTRTLIYRVAFLLEQGITPERILLLTFTNKAANEMMRRVRDLLGDDLTALWGGTFHSIGHRILRRHATLLGRTTDFTILDREDQKDLLEACIGSAGINVKEVRFPKAEVLAEVFSLAVNTRRELNRILIEEFDYFASLEPEIRAVQKAYEERKRATDVMDFDDLLVLWLQLFKEHAEICEGYQRRFQFILVDEYQDTNQLQGELIDLLGQRHANVMAVGDDSQSIYSWRGANFRNILEFPQRYPQAKVFKIEVNYRSTPEILTLANHAIAANTAQFAKTLTPVRKSGMKPALVSSVTAAEQAAFVAQRILELRDEGVALQDMAVLYRAHFHAMELQLELTRRNIPFSITSGMRFFEQAHIKDVAAHLRLAANPRDELAFKRVIRLLKGIGGKTADRAWSHFAHAVAAAPGEDMAGRVPKALVSTAGHIPPKAKSDWTQLVATFQQLAPLVKAQDCAKMIGVVLEAGYEDYLKETYTNYRSRLDDVRQLMDFARRFDSLEEFLSQLALMTNVEAEEDRSKPKDTEQLKLSTVHQAKGLEYDVVFVIMLCEGLFPSSRSLDSAEALEEERRLFYVATTRAKNELYLCHPSMRFSRGHEGLTLLEASRFLRELPEKVHEHWNLKGGLSGIGANPFF